MGGADMFIECVKNNGTDYLRVVEGYTVKDKTATKSRRRVVRNIGPLSRFDDGEPDYLARLRKSFKEGKPIIPLLEDLAAGGHAKRTVCIHIDLDDENACFSNPKNIGYFLLDGLYDALGVYDVLNKYKSQSKLEYDLNGISKLLVFGRALQPESKIRTYNAKERYLFDVAKTEHAVEAYRALDALHTMANTIQKRMNHKIAKGIGRDTEVCFYDVTNFWFEIDGNDEDTLDKYGNLLEEGQRKRGVSKENRSEPIVQMGLFIDSEGLPIAYRLFPGNRTDQTTLRPALRKSIDEMSFGRVVIVADGGLNNGPNIAHILSRGNGYIVSKSTKKSDKKTKAWMFDEEGYTWNERMTFKHKSEIRKRKIRDEGGREVEITEKIVCYWSKKHYDRETRDNAAFIRYLKSVMANPDKLKDKPRKIEKFLRKTVYDKETGEILKNAGTKLCIDEEKVQDYIDSLGYYTVMTSEIEKSDREIIDRYHGLSRIEDSFRITKSDLEGRPVYVSNPGHINAHFLICFIALTMIRLIQHRILLHQGKGTASKGGWESGLSAERIQAALDSWQADLLPGGYYRLSKPGDDLKLILNAFGIDPDLRLPTTKDLHRLKYSFDKTAFM